LREYRSEEMFQTVALVWVSVRKRYDLCP
jgi:hypothetical protein